MRINVRLFAGHRERAGRSNVELEVPEGATVGTLADIADTAEKIGVRNPAVVVVGPVVRALRGGSE